MSDEKLRDLERRAKLGEDVRVPLRAEQVRLGIRKTFPPRRKVPNPERAGIAFPTWCPVCRTWSLRRASQKQRMKRGREGDPAEGQWAAGKPRRLYRNTGPKLALPTRFCTHVDREPFPLRFVPGQGIVRNMRCPGPKKGEHVRIPLDVLEARFARRRDEEGLHILPQEREWLRWRIKRTIDRLPVSRVITQSLACSHARLDYLRRPQDDPIDRTRVVCLDCAAILDAQDGRVLEEGRAHQRCRFGDAGHEGPCEPDPPPPRLFQDYQPLDGGG